MHDLKREHQIIFLFTKIFPLGDTLFGFSEFTHVYCSASSEYINLFIKTLSYLTL